MPVGTDQERIIIIIIIFPGAKLTQRLDYSRGVNKVKDQGGVELEDVESGFVCEVVVF